MDKRPKPEKVVQAVCPHCGAVEDVYQSVKVVICDACGRVFVRK